MKMLPEHYIELKKLIAATYSVETLRDKKRLYREGGYTETRLLFDLFYAIPFDQRVIWFDETAFYGYGDDTHLETALRRIVNELLK